MKGGTLSKGRWKKNRPKGFSRDAWRQFCRVEDAIRRANRPDLRNEAGNPTTYRGAARYNDRSDWVWRHRCSRQLPFEWTRTRTGWAMSFSWMPW